MHSSVEIKIPQRNKTIMTILLNDCPILPSVSNYYAHTLKPVICDLNTTCLKNPHDYDRMRSLLDKVPYDSQLEVMSRFLFYFLQCCRLPFDDDIKQSVRIMNILKLSPQSASARDAEGMTSLHYYCMRGTSDLDILHRLLEINRDLPGIENNFGETPLHQVVGQIRPNPAIVAAFLKACPSAFRQASQSSRKYPLHVILANTRLSSNPGCLKSAELVMEGYPEAATIEVQEDRLILQVGGPSGGIRCQRKWNPLKRAKEEIPLLFRFMERHYSELGLQRLFPGAGKNQQHMRLLHRNKNFTVNSGPILSNVAKNFLKE